MRMSEVLAAPVVDAPDTDIVHRDSGSIQRPSQRVTLNAVLRDSMQKEGDQSDPTPDLVLLQKGPAITLPELSDELGYLVWCANTEETWYAPTLDCLNMNFIYRDDLEVFEITDKDSAYDWALQRNQNLMPGLVTRKTCYILDNPSIEKYEVYYNPDYPSQRYGKCSPKGTTVRSYKDRFARDIAILELDRMYSSSSAKLANKFASNKLNPYQAIIISDGSYMRDNTSFTFYFIDADSVVKTAECCLPSDAEQGTIIAEVNGAYRALSMCYNRRKTDVTYYYDNTSILSVLRTNKMESVPEIRRYRKLCETMNDHGYQINFVEIHPKTGDNKEEENKALMFFHNSCDAECRNMSELFHRDYRKHATTGNKDGISYSSISKSGKKKSYK